MEKNLSCISFTTETDSAQGYEDHPSYLEDIWPALESNLSAIVRIYAFRHEKGKNVDSLVENCREVSPGLYDLGKGKSMVPNKLHEVKFMSFYKGDRNVFYEIPSEAFLIQFLSMWPHRSEIEDDVKMIGLANNDNNNLYKFAASVCTEGVVLITFLHDADTIYAIGQRTTLESILRQI